MYVYECSPEFMSVHNVHALTSEAREGIRSPGTRVMESESHLVGTGNWILVIWKQPPRSSILLFCHLFSCSPWTSWTLLQVKAWVFTFLLLSFRYAPTLPFPPGYPSSSGIYQQSSVANIAGQYLLTCLSFLYHAQHFGKGLLTLLSLLATLVYDSNLHMEWSHDFASFWNTLQMLVSWTWCSKAQMLLLHGQGASY